MHQNKLKSNQIFGLLTGFTFATVIFLLYSTHSGTSNNQLFHHVFISPILHVLALHALGIILTNSTKQNTSNNFKKQIYAKYIFTASFHSIESEGLVHNCLQVDI